MLHLKKKGKNSTKVNIYVTRKIYIILTQQHYLIRYQIIYIYISLSLEEIFSRNILEKRSKIVTRRYKIEVFRGDADS